LKDDPETFMIQAGEVSAKEGKLGTASFFSEEELRKHLAPYGSPEEIATEIEKARTDFKK
jgi:hypothetical protein